ncbi:unannotated protein [freshwater metagenome]|uniref:Unannotated protein n=1 Tax=freshwater metagenome TaxID=449393 RepID=A0A6J6IG58_9ZZZZ
MAVRAAAISSSARVGAAISAPPYFFSAAARPVAIALSHAGSLLKSLRSIFVAPLKTDAANATDFSRKSAGSYTASTTPSESASLAFIIWLLLSALSMIT